MFVPSHQERMVDRALGTAELDVAILDLEDGVPYAERAGGRARLAKLLESRPTMPGPARYVRVNAPATSDLVADLEAVVRAGLDGVVLPSGVLGTEVPLDPGDHLLEVSAPHKVPWSQNVRLGPDTVIEEARRCKAAILGIPMPNIDGKPLTAALKQ